MHKLIIGTNDAGQRVDKFLTKACPQLPQSLLYKAFRKKDIKQNGRHCPAETILAEGDVLQVYLPDDCFTAAKPMVPLSSSLPAPDICYEDAQIAVLYKPVGLPVHTDDHGTQDTLVARWLQYLIKTGAYRPEQEQSFRPALCNRLDRNTDGFVFAAKTAESLRCLNEKIRLGEVEKQYLCVTFGAPPKREDVVTAYHRKGANNQVTLSKVPRAGFREIRTGYRVLEQAGELSLILVTLLTGRTHQIRAQLAALGCPIVGDGRYGNVAINQRYGERQQLLSACRVRLAFSEEPCCLSALRGKQWQLTPPFCATYFPNTVLDR